MEAPCFVTDIYLPQMLYALTIRSPIARGRLVSIDCPKLPGSYALITAKDVPGRNLLEDTLLPVLAEEELAFIGQPVALLLGPDKNTLEDYSRLCTLATEESTPVFTPGEAGAERIVARRDIRVGNPESAFSQAASVVSGTYECGIQEHWYAEPSGAASWLEEKPGGKGTLVVRAATQWPFHVRRSVAQALGLSASRVLVRPTALGLHMDGKLWYPSLVSCHAALGAWITKRPVRLILTREEDFSFSPKRPASIISISSALDELGEIAAIDITATVNLGAYGIDGAETLDQLTLGSLGLYRAKNIQFSGTALRTNIPPQGPFAGFGLAQGFYAIERHASNIADSLRQDPAQWRLDNGVKTGLLPLGMAVRDAPSVGQLVGAAVGMSDYRRKWASYELLRQGRRQAEKDGGRGAEKGEVLRGIGIALGYQGSSLLYAGCDKGSYGIELVLDKDGTLEIKTSAGLSSGIWVQTASQILGIDEGMVRINGSSESPDSGPLVMSRNITVLTRLLEQACLAISKKRFREALPISVRKTVRPQKNPAWESLFPHAPNAQRFPNLSLDSSGFIRPGWASAIVEIEADPAAYLPRVRGVWMGVDGGKIIAEGRARSILKASAVQALGWAYRERLRYAGGVIPKDQLDNFAIPGPDEIPPISIDFINGGQGEPKGIGDLPFSCIPAAYAQAVSQALDRDFPSIPVEARHL